MWILQIVSGDSSKTLFRLPHGAVRTFGRATGVDFVVDAPLVSRVHCRVTALPDGELEVTDLGSTNGTYVNDARIETARMKAGDRLRIGRVEITAGQEAN